MRPPSELLERFRSDLDALIDPGARIGIAVSGGPDSMALLLLAAEARPGLVEAATVDHALRQESGAEAEMVAQVSAGLGVPHAILRIEWDVPPTTAIQEQAREVRYGALAQWALERELGAVVTAHHLDDQVETLVMRLARGAGVKGLAGMRQAAALPGSDMPLLRPLLSWRRSELAQICADAGIEPVADPSNSDEQFERVRVRRALADAEWLYPEALAASAANLAEADAALRWATEQEWAHAVDVDASGITYRSDGAPAEIRRRIIARAIASLATEGVGEELRGRELERLLDALQAGSKATLRGVLCKGGSEWRFVPAPKRTRPVTNSR